MRRALAAAGVVVGLVGIPASAGAAVGGSTTDPTGDTIGHPPSAADVDLTNATASPAGKKHKKLRFEATVVGNASVAAKQFFVYLSLDDYAHANEFCDFYVGWVDGKPGVYECNGFDRVGPAKIVASGPHTVHVDFKKKYVESPEAFDWAVMTRGMSDGMLVTFDRAPGDRAQSGAAWARYFAK